MTILHRSAHVWRVEETVGSERTKASQRLADALLEVWTFGLSTLMTGWSWVTPGPTSLVALELAPPSSRLFLGVASAPNSRIGNLLRRARVDQAFTLRLFVVDGRRASSAEACATLWVPVGRRGANLARGAHFT